MRGVGHPHMPRYKRSENKDDRRDTYDFSIPYINDLDVRIVARGGM